MKNHLVLSALFLMLLGSTYVLGQTKYQPYNWDDQRAIFASSEADTLGLYAVKSTIRYQFAYDENEEFICYKTKHQIFKVNNDEAVSSTNRIYIPMRSTSEIMAVKARAFGKDGSVKELDDSNIKELEDEEVGYRIFAIEGAEVGGEVEYYYTLKLAGFTFGSEYLQDDFPILDYSFELVAPENLEFEFKLYNDDSQVVQTDTTDQENSYKFSERFIPALHEEGFSVHNASRKRLEFRLSYNSFAGKSRLNTWSAAGKRVFDAAMSRDKEEEKALLKIMKSLGITPEMGWQGMLMAEHKIKTGYFLDNKTGDVADHLVFIEKNKFGSARGYARLYAGLAEKLGIPYEMVVTCDRFDARLDPEFENWTLLDDFMLYFPEQNTYLTPDAFSFRVGTIPSDKITNNALFIKPEPIQDYVYPVTQIRQLPEPDYQSNFDNLDIEVSFNDNLEGNTVDVKRSFVGYSAQYYKASTLVLEEDDKKKMLDEIVKYLALDADIKNIEVTEADMSYQKWLEPYTVSSTFESNGYIEKAGNTILFKVGELIGPQTEMYQDNIRQTDVVNSYNRGYLRKIQVKLPEGYALANPEDITLKKEVKDGDKAIYIFDANYEISGSDLLITIDEWYDRIYYPKEQFEPFRAVVNAAADWNKIVLVLNKE